jgi:hypothetical protein
MLSASGGSPHGAQGIHNVLRVSLIILSHTGYGGGPQDASGEEQGVRCGFNLCVVPLQDAVSYFRGRENVRAFGRVEQDEGKT